MAADGVPIRRSLAEQPSLPVSIRPRATNTWLAMVTLQEQYRTMATPDLDEDLADLDRDALIAEVKRLRAGIRLHRDSVGHELCWHHPQLWGLLPEKSDPQPSVPAWPQFLRGCIQYRESLDRQLPGTPRTADELTTRR